MYYAIEFGNQLFLLYTVFNNYVKKKFFAHTSVQQRKNPLDCVACNEHQQSEITRKLRKENMNKEHHIFHSVKLLELYVHVTHDFP